MKPTILLTFLAATVSALQPTDPYNVVWNSPSRDSSGSMPVGNGDVGLNVWTEENGDVLFYIAKSDAWSENVRLLKVGRVRLRLSPNPFAAGEPFRQTLNLAKGEILLEGGKPGSQAKLTIWVDARNPVIRVETETQQPTEVQAIYERWRNQTRVLDGEEADSAYGLEGGPEPVRALGDVIHQDVEDAVIWYHRNTKSPWLGILKHQGLAELEPSLSDPLQGLTFGAAMVGDGFGRLNATTLRSSKRAQNQAVSIYLHTAMTDSSEAWVRELQNKISRIDATRPEDRRTAHDKYWSDFWDRSYIRITGGPEAHAVTQGYILQRFLNACAGRGAYPIQFNGSLFTVDAKVKDLTFDADYRRSGGSYRFQDTRVMYWPMLASGDGELIEPLFAMYREALLLAIRRTKLYFNHDGGFFPEAMFFWGCYTNTDYGWNREGKPPSYVENTFIRNHFTGNLELLALGLEYSQYYSQDKQFVRTILGPLADAIIVFYGQHYERDANGKIRAYPSPDIAGLKYVLTRMLAEKIPLSKPAQAAARRLLQALPELPMKEVAGKKILTAAERVSGDSKNTENPELYAVFPFRLYGVAKPEIAVGRDTFEARKFKDAIQAAYLGLANVARRQVVDNFSAKSEQRFPAFWGPGFDWIPDQTHGNVAGMALQSMLLQVDGDKILVSPAWPKDWDVEFRLHAPSSTVVEGVIRNGKLDGLKVIPEKRSADIVRLDPQ